MKNYLSKGDTLPLTAPAGGVTGGILAVIGSLAIMPVADASEGQIFAGMRVGEFDQPLPVKDGVTPSQGDKCYLITAEKELTTTASGNKLIGVFTNDAGGVLLTGELI